MIGSRNYSFITILYFVVVVVCFSYVVHGATFYNQSHNYLQDNFALERKEDFRIPESPRNRSYRKSKLFPLFTLIRFANEICKTTSEETGVCYTRSQCTALGGLAQGNCASGLGVCCRFVATCGAIIYQNGTSFQNPNYPSKYTPSGGSDICQVRVRKQHNICQLRLNFIAFDIQGPMSAPTTTGTAVQNDAGVCKTDSLAITSSGSTVPSLCGKMTGQHIYVDFGSSDTVTLNLLLGGSTNSQVERTWNIEILTIPCTSTTRAPTGCLQYYTGVSGQVESFNYLDGTHLANLDYSTCVRVEDGMRFIDWTPCVQGGIRFGGGAATPPTAPMPNTVCGAVPDYLIIPQGVQYPLVGATANPTTSPYDRYCDTTFLAAGSYVRTSAKPFFMHVRTDGNEGGTTDMTSQGYCFRWQQNPQ